jgi:carboxyl-terminal processing protease
MKFLPAMTLKFIQRFVIFVIFTSVIFTSGLYIGFRIQTNKQGNVIGVNLNREVPEGKNIDFSLFWQIWDTLDTSYYDHTKLNEVNMVYGAIKGMVEAVGDPYTTYLKPEENKVVEQDLQGNFEGVGIQIGFIGTQLAVAAPLPGSPAEEVGVKAGDYIIGIKDEQKGIDRGTVGISLPEAVEDIRGPAGSTVTLALVREGEQNPIIVDIKRASIDVPSVSVDYIGDNKQIAHIKLMKFGGDTVNEWDNTVADIFSKGNIDGIILDVRNNTGGYLQAAVSIASDFVDPNSVVVIEQSAKDKEELRSNRLPRLQNLKTVMLVNKGSASASEILAGALRDDKSIQLIGTTTFGKGTIQEPQQIEDGSSLHITIARWLTPTEYWVNEKGLDPDQSVEDDPNTKEDEQLQAGVKYILNSQ